MITTGIAASNSSCVMAPDERSACAFSISAVAPPLEATVLT